MLLRNGTFSYLLSSAIRISAITKGHTSVKNIHRNAGAVYLTERRRPSPLGSTWFRGQHGPDPFPGKSDFEFMTTDQTGREANRPKR